MVTVIFAQSIQVSKNILILVIDCKKACFRINNEFHLLLIYAPAFNGKISGMKSRTSFLTLKVELER